MSFCRWVRFRTSPWFIGLRICERLTSATEGDWYAARGVRGERDDPETVVRVSIASRNLPFVHDASAFRITSLHHARCALRSQAA